MNKIFKKKLILIIILAIATILRLWKLQSVPVSMFGDELDVGYHAYSILKTGRDYSGNLLPFHFHSLAEWRTPLYLYSAVPTVALFGISPLEVRLPAAIFGILNVLTIYLLSNEIMKHKIKKTEIIGLTSAFVMAISPWHIQYSRAGFEITLLLLFVMLAVLFLLKSRTNGKYLYFSAVLFALSPWVYSTAKLFIPLFVSFITAIYAKDLLKIKKQYLFGSSALFLLISLPVIYSILVGEGGQRFSYVGIFNIQNIEEQIGIARQLDNSIIARLFHNKYILWADIIFTNFFGAVSTDFLFMSGDINPRHSIEGMGMFYKVEVVALLLGVCALYSMKVENKSKIMLVLWVILGILPSTLTMDGAYHATRLSLILPPLIMLIAMGIRALYKYKLLIATYLAVLIALFVHYQHLYWVHNPVNSEVWWHFGWDDVVSYAKEHEGEYEKIIISTQNEPPWIFFASNYQYDPIEWQDAFPFDNKKFIAGFGDVSFIGKYYFGSPIDEDVYSYGDVIDESTLYISTSYEVGPNLIANPESIPDDLVLLKSVAYPSGLPAFYIFRGKNE